MQDIALGEQAGQRVEVAGGRLLEAVADRGLVLRLEYVVSAAGLIQEVLLLVGDALSCLWGPAFYQDHLVPMLRRYEAMFGGLMTYDARRGAGSP